MLKKLYRLCLSKLFLDLPVPLLIIFFTDRFTKFLANQYLSLEEDINLFPGLNLSLAYNQGAAFSFLSDASGWQHGFFIGISIVISVILMWWLQSLRADQKAERFSVILILSGAIGNLYDRIRLGHVIDFIDVYYKHYHWPTFNIADSAICLGVAWLLFQMSRKSS